MPISFTGMPRSTSIASTTPPFAEPSSLVSTTPVTPTASANWRACARPFCPVVASMTSRTSCGAPGVRSAMRWIFLSSSRRLTLVCMRRAVSTSTTPAPRPPAASTASKTTEPGSAPSCPRTTSAPTRSAQCVSWSAAAARKVSAAAISATCPSSISRCASLAIVVVLPVPLTPTNSHTVVPSGAWCSDRSTPERSSTISSRKRVTSCSGSSTRAAAARACSSASNREVVVTPTSATSSASSMLSQASSSIVRRPVSAPRDRERAARVLPSRSRRRGGPGGAPTPPLGAAACARGGAFVGGGGGVPGGVGAGLGGGRGAGLGGGRFDARRGPPSNPPLLQRKGLDDEPDLHALRAELLDPPHVGLREDGVAPALVVPHGIGGLLDHADRAGDIGVAVDLDVQQRARPLLRPVPNPFDLAVGDVPDDALHVAEAGRSQTHAFDSATDASGGAPDRSAHVD